MGYTILDNTRVHELLISLSRHEIVEYLRRLESTLQEFATGEERNYQPETGCVARPDGQRVLFRPFTSETAVGTKLIVEPAPAPDGRRPPISGILVVCDKMGSLSGILAAEELTGYRTSLSVMIPFSWRKHVDHIVVFGAGMQALWHSRLALGLRGADIQTITYVNPTESRATQLMGQIREENEAHWKSPCQFTHVAGSPSGRSDALQKALQLADAVFCTTPSKAPLFPAEYILRGEEGARQPFVAAVGSWQADMIELHPDIMHHAADRDSLLVDDRVFALENTGELTQSGLTLDDMVDIGRAIEVRAGAQGPLEDGTSAEALRQRTSEGFLVYKSVGISLTDLTAASVLLDLAGKA